MKEIGGYFQMENLSGHEYHNELLRLNLGRTALLYALQELKVKELYLPYFLCDSVTSVCEKWGGIIHWYSITEDFLPKLPSEIGTLPDGIWLYLVNYYGQLTDDKIHHLHLKYKNLIIDHTHSFFQRPIEGIPSLYSCRKFFGLPDGAYLYLKQTPANYETLPTDSSASRMTHILGRYEHSASDYYQNMLDTAHSFYDDPIRQMSPLTRNLLKGIDYEAVRNQREKNFDALEKYLEPYNHKHFFKPEAPFVYPFYFPDLSQSASHEHSDYSSRARALKKALAAHKIFVPTYWNNVIDSLSENTLEWKFASCILPLPIDQRYSTSDMKDLASVFMQCLSNI